MWTLAECREACFSDPESFAQLYIQQNCERNNLKYGGSVLCKLHKTVFTVIEAGVLKSTKRSDLK